jgi:RNA polymerase sigma-70 factor (ECF subfamily)
MLSSQTSTSENQQTLLSLEGSVPHAVPSRTAQDDLAKILEDGRPRNLRFLRSRLPSREDAEDALQDASLKLFQNIEALATVDNPHAWIAASLNHTVIDRYRRGAARRRLSDAIAAEPSAPDEPQDSDLATPAACVSGEVKGLKATFRTLLGQVYLEGMPLKEVAAREGLTANNAAVRLHRARGALRQAMQSLCQSCPADDCWARGRFDGRSEI